MMHIKKIWIIIAFFGLIVLLYLMLRKGKPIENPKLPFLECTNNTPAIYSIFFNKKNFPVFNILDEQSKLSSGRNIFFLETSCFNKMGTAKLNCRQACAVESAARTNPNMTVNLLYFNVLSVTNRTKEFMALLREHYKNIRMSHVSIKDYIKDSPIEEWYKSGVIKTSLWPVSHLSDVMRYITLWKFGGIYMDLDVVVIKSLDDLSNFAAAESDTTVASGVLGFTSESPGPEIAEACLHDLMKNFDGQNWNNNGPLVITRVLRDFCGVHYTADMTPERCSGFQVFPTSVFNPIFYEQWQLYFEEQQSKETMEKIMQARAINVWNSRSKGRLLHQGSTAPYALIAKSYCPFVYESCQSAF